MSRKQYFVLGLLFLFSYVSCIISVMVVGADGPGVVGVAIGFPLLAFLSFGAVVMTIKLIIETIMRIAPKSRIYLQNSWLPPVKRTYDQVFSTNAGEFLYEFAVRNNLKYVNSLSASEFYDPQYRSGHSAVGQYQNCEIMFHTDDIETLVSCKPIHTATHPTQK